MGLNARELFERRGKLIHLKRLDTEYLDLYVDNLMNTSIETIILTVTPSVFNKTGIEKYVRDAISDNSRMDFLIFTNDTEKLVGEVVIHDIDTGNRSAGIRIAVDKKKDYGKGYGTEALILAMNYAFGMRNLHRLELEVLNINDRAYHVYEKIGFKKEGIKRDANYFNHKYYDLISMSILEEEFREKYLKNDYSIEKLLEY